MNKYKPIETRGITELIESTRRRYLDDPKKRTRYAFEWFVREQDLMYYRWALEEINKSCGMLYRLYRRMIAIAATSAILSIVALTIAFLCSL